MELRRPAPRTLVAATLLTATWSACAHAPTPVTSVRLPRASADSPVLPQPIEHLLEEGVEAQQKSRRKAWFAERHAAPPGVDWRAIEEANGLAQIAKRNDLARVSRRQAQGFASPWVERGSENQSGRMHVAMLSPDGQMLYAGSSKGGVWRGALDGSSWTPIGDNLFGGAHHLAVVSGAGPGDPDVVLAASDDGRVHVSVDDGATWVPPAGLSNLSAVRRVLVSSEGSETVFVMARQSNRSRLFRSTDRMASFQLLRSFGSGSTDAWMPRTGGTEIYATGAGVLRRSLDFGDTWTLVSNLPGSASSSELCGSEAGAPRLWLIAQNAGRKLYRSDDAGATWSYVTDVSDYWGTLNASITDANVFAWGGVEVWRTDDGGLSFAKVNSWGAYYSNPATKLHADIPGMDVWPDGQGGETWYVATDGGLYESTDRLAKVRNLSLTGLRVSQYYSTLTGRTNGDRVIAGAQDQGYQFGDRPPPATRTTISFDQLISGDYGHLTAVNGNLGYVFSTYPGFILAQIGASVPSLHQLSFPGAENNAWLPPVVASVQNNRDFFFCATHLYLYTHQGGSNWSVGQHSARDFATVSGEYLSALTFSPLQSTRAYAATNRGRLYTSNDYGVTWSQSADLGPQAHYFYGTALLASRTDVDTVWVGGSGYGVPAIYRSTDGGATFQPFDEGLPDTLVYCLGEAPDGSGTLFCGTETAAYMRRTSDPTWIDITGNEAPVTIYWSVESLHNENTMRFGTYGRGIWDYQVDAQARTVSYNGSGLNRACFASLADPELGGTWNLEVDATGHAGATLSGFLIHAAPASGSFLSGYEVLVDLGSPKLMTRLAPSSGGPDGFALPVPADPSLAGRQAYAQAMVLGGGLELCNALEVVLGY